MSEAAVTAMAANVCVVLGADVSVAVTGVAGPDPQEGEEPGTVWMATCVDGAVDVPAVVRRGGCSGRRPETHCRRLHQHPLCLLRCQPGFRLHKPLSSGRMMTTMTPTARTTMLVRNMRRKALSLQ